MCLQVRASHYSGLLSPSFIFSCTTTASIFQMHCQLLLFTTWKWNLETISLNIERLSLEKTKLQITNYRIVAFILLPYNTSIILKLRGHRKGRLISILNFFRKIYRTVKKLFANLLKYTEMFTEPLTIVPWYIRIITFFPAIGWSYLDDLSHMFFKRLKLHVKSASFSTDNNRTYCIRIVHFFPYF